jgi:hypothetical protein
MLAIRGSCQQYEQAMLYTTTTFPLMSLVNQIKSGSLGLPELQRPFVWPNAKVRDLFDSLYRGYPTGFLLLWQTGAAVQGIGLGEQKTQTPSLAVVDGQQRLTSLYAVATGAEVLRADFRKERIRVAFDPLAERFEVANAATEKDPAFIADISGLLSGSTSLFELANSHLDRLGAVRDLSSDEIRQVQTSIDRLSKLSSVDFNALVLGSEAEVETVAEVFVRINGQGIKLNEADFILTLMSVFWEEGRKKLEAFSREAAGPPDGRPSPRNHYLRPSPSQLLRVLAGVGLKRGRLSAVYAALRGRVPQTGKTDAERQQAAFKRLEDALPAVLNLTRWHHFLGSLPLTGHLSGRTITSEQAVLYAYAIYLIGVEERGVAVGDMGQAAAEFLFMAGMTSRYAASGESQFEADLAVLSDDFWDITLPNALATSGANTPARHAYWAALVKLDANVLYSGKKVAAALMPGVAGPKALAENHHLFPKAYLAKLGITDQKATNQIANYAWVEWPDNLKIGAKAPAEYAPELDATVTANDRKLHALPPEWWNMDYQAFLETRRVQMAQVIRQAWEQIRGGKPIEAPAADVAALVQLGETASTEFKSTLRTNLHTRQHDPKMEFSVLKTVAAFLNSGGGTLLIGVADDGTPLGLAADGFANEDRQALHLMNLIEGRIGGLFKPYVHPEFVELGECRVLSVRVERGPKPAFLQDGNQQRFYVRGGPSTQELHGNDAIEYAKAHWK